MGAVDVLQHLHAAGLHLALSGDKIMVTPSGKLTDDLRKTIKDHRDKLLRVLSPIRQSGNSLMTADQADGCHAYAWADAEIFAFTTRVQMLLRRGLGENDAADLAERLTLRDREGDDRRMCVECGAYRPGRCGNHRRAGLGGADVGRDLAAMLQRCAGFLKAEM